MPSSMTSAEELDAARVILGLEAEVLEALAPFCDLPGVQQVFAPAPPSKTRYPAVERLRAAVKVLRGCGAPARRVTALWDRSEDQRWKLAMCCDHIARKEAEKNAGLLDEEDLHTDVTPRRPERAS